MISRCFLFAVMVAKTPNARHLQIRKVPTKSSGVAGVAFGAKQGEHVALNTPDKSASIKYTPRYDSVRELNPTDPGYSSKGIAVIVGGSGTDTKLQEERVIAKQLNLLSMECKENEWKCNNEASWEPKRMEEYDTRVALTFNPHILSAIMNKEYCKEHQLAFIYRHNTSSVISGAAAALRDGYTMVILMQPTAFICNHSYKILYDSSHGKDITLANSATATGAAGYLLVQNTAAARERLGRWEASGISTSFSAAAAAVAAAVAKGESGVDIRDLKEGELCFACGARAHTDAESTQMASSTEKCEQATDIHAMIVHQSMLRRKAALRSSSTARSSRTARSSSTVVMMVDNRLPAFFDTTEGGARKDEIAGERYVRRYGYWSQCAELNIRWACQQGYDFLYYRTHSAVAAGPGTKDAVTCTLEVTESGRRRENRYRIVGREASFCKLPAVADALLVRGYSTVIFVDSDAFWNERMASFEHLRALYSDMHGTEQGASWEDWSMMGVSNWPWGDVQPNGGFFAFRNRGGAIQLGMPGGERVRAENGGLATTSANSANCSIAHEILQWWWNNDVVGGDDWAAPYEQYTYWELFRQHGSQHGTSTSGEFVPREEIVHHPLMAHHRMLRVKAMTGGANGRSPFTHLETSRAKDRHAMLASALTVQALEDLESATQFESTGGPQCAGTVRIVDQFNATAAAAQLLAITNTSWWRERWRWWGDSSWWAERGYSGVAAISGSRKQKATNATAGWP
jgi:hypothetical protein